MSSNYTVFKLHGLLVSIMLCLLISGCSDKYEWEKFVPVDVEIDGIDYQDGSICTKQIAVPASGARFSVTPVGKYAKDGYVRFVHTHGGLHTVSASTDNLVPFNIEDEIDIKYESGTAPSKTWITIAPNNTDEPRYITVHFGPGGYHVTNIMITQETRD